MRFRTRKVPRNACAPKAPRLDRPRTPFDPADAWETARAILSAPPKKPHIRRVEPVGELVARWLLPLECAPTSNAMLKMAQNNPWKLVSLKKSILSRMLRQHKRAKTTLPGRPFLRVVVFSSGREDHDRSRSKLIVDRLQRGRRPRPDVIPLEQWRTIEPTLPPLELGYLRDDTVEALDLHTWQEPAPPKRGCVLVELYSGAPSPK